MIDNDELDAWLYEVETTSNRVKDILSGKIDIKKLDEEERIKKEKKEKDESKKRFKEEEKKRQEEERLKKGRKGGGNLNNYEKFCKFCHFEYEVEEFINCTHCGKDLITREDRLKELKTKVEELKQNKAKKKFRRAKYENWIKSESIIKTRTFRNYQKWQLYESSSEEDEKAEPILPKNDPNFLAFEKDMIETQKAREASMKKALKLKDEGNLMMKEGKHKKAIKLYSDAIEECKGMMVLYSNRALAFLKAEEYDNALKDCDKIIEYLDIFEEEKKHNKDLLLKAYCRKAQVEIKLKNFESAKECVECAKVYSIEEEILKLSNLIEMENDLFNKSLAVFDCESENYKKINKLFEDLRDSVASNSENFKLNYVDNKNNLSQLAQELKKDENLKLYFIKKGGLELIFSFIKKYPDLLEILIVFNIEEKFMIQVNNIKGYNKLVNILFLSDEYSQNFKLPHFKLIVEILEDSSQVELIRKTLSSIRNFQVLFMASFLKFDISQQENLESKETVIILMHFFTFICNICYSSPEIRSEVAKNYNLIIQKINSFSKLFKLDYILNKNLLETILSFLGNMACDTEFRRKLTQEIEFIKFLINNLNTIVGLCKFTEEYELYENTKKGKKEVTYYNNMKEYESLFEKIIALLYNISFKDELNLFYTEEKLSEPLIYFINKIYSIFYKEKYKEYFLEKRKTYYSEFDRITLIRVVMMLSKTTKNLPEYSHKEKSAIFKTFLDDNEFFLNLFEMLNLENLKNDTVIIDNLIKICAHLFTFYNSTKEKYMIEKQENNIKALPIGESIHKSEKKDLQLEKSLDKVICDSSCENLIKNLREIFSEDYKNIDKCQERIINNMSLMNAILNNFNKKSIFLKNIIQNIINIAKDKLDLLRKNAALLLAKIAKSSEEMEKTVRELHGIDVIMNVAKFIKLDK